MLVVLADSVHPCCVLLVTTSYEVNRSDHSLISAVVITVNTVVDDPVAWHAVLG